MKKNDIINGFTLLVALLWLLTLVLNIFNDRFHPGDFMVYYSAAKNLVTGEPVYMISFYTGSGFYKYSPATLFFFIPYTLFNFNTAAIIHFAILGAAYWYTFMVIRKVLHDYFPFENLKHELGLISLAFVCILIHFARELYVGNINIILLMLCCISIRNFLRGKDMQGGILLGIVILVKPYLMILLLPLVLRKRWNTLVWLCLTITLISLLPFVFPGPQRSISMYGDWINSILMHSGGFPGKTSLDYFIRQLMPSWPAWGIPVIFFFCCAIVSMFILKNIHQEKPESKLNGFADVNFAFEWFLMIALLPNLIKTDWVLLVFSAPLIAFMIFYTASRKQYWWIPFLVILLFFYGANSDDLLGRELSHRILESGLMGLSNFLLVIVSIVMFLDLRKKTT
ncbi:MAG: glycosyltransferase family 87 protein [Bacteroidales bacterium]|nr:glycosyltransferase family 87 protein [Bacteroidales bacterium]